MQESRGSDEINLLEYYHVIKRRWKMVVAIVAVASVLAVVISFLLPKKYTAKAVIIPVSSGGGSGGLSKLASQFSGFASISGIGLPGSADDSDKIMAILKSRTLAENVINNENLMPVLFEDSWDEKNGRWRSDEPDKIPNMEKAVKIIKGAVQIKAEKKEKTIELESTFKSPELAASLANAYLRELQNFINGNTLTTAKKHRIFIGEQLSENKREFLEAGKEINVFYKSKGISNVESNLDVSINVQPKMYQTEVQKMLGDISVSDETKTIPLDSMLEKKNEIENKIKDIGTVQDVPQQVYLTYLMMRRELLAKLNALLTTQYEMAKIEESQEELSFQVIDYAVPPIMRSSPKRAQICILAFFAALFSAIFLAFLREYLHRMGVRKFGI